MGSSATLADSHESIDLGTDALSNEGEVRVGAFPGASEAVKDGPDRGQKGERTKQNICHTIDNKRLSNGSLLNKIYSTISAKNAVQAIISI